MAGRGPPVREDSGRGRGRGTPGRGGRFGGFAAGPSPLPGGGRGQRGGGSFASPQPGVSPGAGGGRGRGSSGGTNSSPAANAGRGRGYHAVPPPPPLSSQQQQRPKSQFDGSPSGSPYTAGGGRGGRGHAGRGGSPASNSTTFMQGGGNFGGVGGGRVFGRGADAVAYDRDKERGLWKVGPPMGQRFSAAFLHGLTNFVAWQYTQQAAAVPAAVPPSTSAATVSPSTPPPRPPPKQQEEQQDLQVVAQQAHEQAAIEAAATGQAPGPAPHTEAPAQPAARPPVTVQALSTPALSRVTVERLPAGSGTGTATPSAPSAGSSGSSRDRSGVEGGSPAVDPPESAHEPAPVPAQGSESGLSSAPSVDSDLGWASVLGHVAAEASAAASSPAASGGSATAGGASSPTTQTDQAAAGVGPGGAAVDTEASASSGVGASDGNGSSVGIDASPDGAAEPAEPAEPAGSHDSRSWWPRCNSLDAALPVPVAAQGALPGAAKVAGAAGPLGSGSRVRLSVRLERMALTDREAGMLADWCCQHKDMADVRKLWLFDSRLGDEGAAAVARILQHHPHISEVHLSHNQLTLKGAVALLSAVPVQDPAPNTAPNTAPVPEPAPAPEPVSTASLATETEEADAGAEGVAEVQPVAAAGQEAAAAAAWEAASPGADTTATGARAGAGAASGAGGTTRPLWLRLEWNRISLEGLMRELEAQHAQRGLRVDLPTALRADAAPSLPDLPPYLETEAAVAPAPPTTAPASRGARNALQFLIERCHVRLPWISCQYQLPSEAAVLKAARSSWRQQRQQHQQAEGVATAAAAAAAAAGAAASPGPAGAQKQELEPELAASLAPVPPPPPPPAPQSSAPSTAGGAASTTSHTTSTTASISTNTSPGSGPSGPLLLFPDTSALLPMLGAGPSVSIPTFLTLDMLGGLAQQGRFGRALPPHEQVFLVVTDSVLKQLDGLKNDGAARPAVRRFLGQGLDAFGPAGHDFLTVLGAHEGEGLVVEHEAAVAGSGSADVSSKGQRADHRIVEVALFFQTEVLREATSGGNTATSGTSGGAGPAAEEGEGGGSGGNAGSLGPGPAPLTPVSFPVLLLSGDNAQVQTARSHGLPAVRMADVAAAQRQLEAALSPRSPLTASLLRACLGAAAVTGLGQVAVRSLQAEFDAVVAALQWCTAALASSQQQLAAARAAAAAAGPGSSASCEGAAEALAAVQQALAGADEESSGGNGSTQLLLPALQARLQEWQQLVRSHQDPSRLLRWAGASSSAEGAGL